MQQTGKRPLSRPFSSLFTSARSITFPEAQFTHHNNQFNRITCVSFGKPIYLSSMYYTKKFLRGMAFQSSKIN
jgi:hypothetical protein